MRADFARGIAIYQLWHVIAAAVTTGIVCANLGVVLGGVLATSKIAGLETRIAELEHAIAANAYGAPAVAGVVDRAYTDMDAVRH